MNVKTGEFVQPIQYQYIGALSQGLIRVRCDTELIFGDTKWGFINEKGNTALPVVYDWAYDFKDGQALVRKNGEWQYIDNSGNNVRSIPGSLRQRNKVRGRLS